MCNISLTSRRRHRQSWLAAASLLTSLLQGCSISSYGESLSHTPQEPLVRRHSLKELRDRYVVKQALDYSCGAAALATLLIFYYGDMTSEAEILTLLKDQLTPEELAIKAERGFSLLDLKKVAQKKGYRAAGFKLTPQQLIRLVAPVIVFVEPQGYKHFSVLRGTQNGMVYLADPSRGNLRMRIDQFAGQGNEWQEGIIFVLGKKGEEKSTAHTLYPTLPFTDLQPQFIGVIDALDQGQAIRNLPMR
jgi:predicted double-glycine peptidase